MLKSNPRTGCQSVIVFVTDGQDTDGEDIRCGPGKKLPEQNFIQSLIFEKCLPVLAYMTQDTTQEVGMYQDPYVSTTGPRSGVWPITRASTVLPR